MVAMNNQHKINYPNIFTILSLGVVGIWVGIAHPTNITFQIPNLILNLELSSEIINGLQIISVCAIVIFVSVMIYSLIGMGGIVGRR
jgi:hypothetical protein